jgi:hypothetical protein
MRVLYHPVVRLMDEPDWQSRLSPIGEIAAQAASAGRSGIHVVTGERARNVRFYERNEFRPLATARWNGADVVFMGRPLCFPEPDSGKRLDIVFQKSNRCLSFFIF